MADTWTVAGSSTTLFGTSWDATDSNNDMTLVDGVYTWTKNAVTLPEGTIEFKVVKDHAWTVAYPDQNYKIVIVAAGAHDIVITFNTTGNVVNATVDGFPVIQIGGSFTSTDWSTVQLIPAGNGLTASATTTISRDAVEMKLIINGIYYTLANVSNVITRVAHTNWEFPVAGGMDNNTQLDADMQGEYTFTYTFATGKLDVTYPQTYTRHFDNAYYSTICLPQAATLTNATAYEIASLNIASGYITLSAPIVGSLTAGKPYIILPSANNVDVTATLSGDPVENTVAGENGLWGVINIGGEPSVSNGNYVLIDNEFHLVTGGSVNVPRFRGALYVSTSGAPALRIIESATNIENIEANEKAIKFIENGKLLIMKNGVVYDTVGTVVR